MLPIDQMLESTPYFFPIFFISPTYSLKIIGESTPSESAGKRNSIPHISRDNTGKENGSFRMKLTFLESGTMRYTENAATNSAKDKTFCPYTLRYLSAISPPTRLPMDSPRRVIPITEVQVKIEEPMIGATILDETISTVMSEKPAMKMLR